MMASDQLIGPLRVEDGASLSAIADGLSRQGVRVCLMVVLDPGERVRTSRPVEFRRGTVRYLLDGVLKGHPGYHWEDVHQQLINVIPLDSVIEATIGDISVRKKPLAMVLAEDLALAKHGISVFEELANSVGSSIDLDLKDCTVRHALNAIVGQLPQAYWRISGVPSALFLTIATTPVGSHR
jgi:hypothetical protein